MLAKRTWPLLVAALVVLGGCGGGSQSATPEAKTDVGAKKAVEGDFKVALLTPGPVSDSGWNALAYEGLQAIQKDLGANVNNQQATGSQIVDAMRSYAQQGYQLVIGHGFEYNEFGVEVAKDFPNTTFVSSSGGATAPNAGAFRFYLEQSFYLAGMTAALASKTGTLAMIGGDKVPSIQSTFKAFRAGAEAAKPGTKVLEIFTGSGTDVAKAKQATLQAINQGADFVIHQANAAAQGVFDAAKERNILAFGANLDQNSNPSGAVVASATIVAQPAFLDVAKRVKEGTFKGEIVLMGMDKGAIDFVINPDLKDRIPADVWTKVEETKAKIKSGELVVPKDEF